MADGPRNALVSIETRVPGLSCGIICVTLPCNRFHTIPECDRHTHTETDGQIHDDGMYCVSIASRGKNRPYCTAHKV